MLAFRPPGGDPKPADREPLKGTNSLILPLFPWHPDQCLIQRRIQGTCVASMLLGEVGTYRKPLFRDGHLLRPWHRKGERKTRKEEADSSPGETSSVRGCGELAWPFAS